MLKCRPPKSITRGILNSDHVIHARSPQPAPRGGFTLLELVIVIAIVAILAAVALPRLIDTQRDARVAKAKAIHGSIRTASALARSRCELDLAAKLASLPVANCQADPPQVNMDGKAIAMAHRFPAASAEGILAAADINLAADGLLLAGPACPDGALCIDIPGGKAPHCRITYQPATAAATGVVAPVISLSIEEC